MLPILCFSLGAPILLNPRECFKTQQFFQQLFSISLSLHHSVQVLVSGKKSTKATGGGRGPCRVPTPNLASALFLIRRGDPGRVLRVEVACQHVWAILNDAEIISKSRPSWRDFIQEARDMILVRWRRTREALTCDERTCFFSHLKPCQKFDSKEFLFVQITEFWLLKARRCPPPQPFPSFFFFVFSTYSQFFVCFMFH